MQPANVRKFGQTKFSQRFAIEEITFGFVFEGPFVVLVASFFELLTRRGLTPFWSLSERRITMASSDLTSGSSESLLPVSTEITS